MHTSCLDRMTSSRLFCLARGVYRRVLQRVFQREVFLRHHQTFILFSFIKNFYCFGVVMASPGKGSCGHIMALFDAHSKCAQCREKGTGQDPCVKKKPCQICDKMPDQKKQLATPTYRTRKELQKKISSPSQTVNPADVTVLGKVESRGETRDRGKTPSKKAKKSSHKSPTKKKAGKISVDFQADLKSMDDK